MQTRIAAIYLLFFGLACGRAALAKPDHPDVCYVRSVTVGCMHWGIGVQTDFHDQVKAFCSDIDDSKPSRLRAYYQAVALANKLKPALCAAVVVDVNPAEFE